jgi:hypothetical protein
MRANINLSLLVIFLLFMASCTNRECRMSTVVNKDGSCERTFEVKLDSAQLVSGKIDANRNIVRTGTGWQLSWSIKGQATRHPLPMSRKTYDSIRSHCSKRVCDTITVFISGKWQSAKVMGEHTCFNLDRGKTVKPETKLRRSFRWFYTYYYYRETYHRQNLYFKVPLEKFMTKDEIGFWFKGYPNLAKGLNGIELDDIMSSIKDKYSKWLTANYFEAINQLIVGNYYLVKNTPVSKQGFIHLHDALQQRFMKEKEDVFDEENTKKLFRDFFHSDAFSAVLDNDKLKDEAYKTLSDYAALSQFSVDYELSMPGIITDSGTGVIGRGLAKNNQQVISYRLTGERLVSGNYIIAAQSRVTNIWAFVIMVLVVLTAVYLCLHKRYKK